MADAVFAGIKRSPLHAEAAMNLGKPVRRIVNVNP
jgi:hypothetical protein